MLRTTVHLPDELNLALARVSAGTGMSQARITREGVRLSIHRSAAPLPTFGIFDWSPDMSERMGELLPGFGESRASWTAEGLPLLPRTRHA